MRHLGDITKLNGEDVPYVDIMTGGSPCQNLSVAGNRKGLEGSESGLFLEQIRLFKEMRHANRGADGLVRGPRFLVWENVKGAFSCSKGEDFRRVLEEIARVAEPDAVVPRPPSGKWSPSGTIVGAGWSIAWRLHDAQFWGVPQRRTRIALVADFGGQSAPEILFERSGLQGNLGPRKAAWEGSPRSVGEGTGRAVGPLSFVERAGKAGGGKGILVRDEQAGTLDTANTQAICASTSYGFDPSAARAVGEEFVEECSRCLTNGTSPGHHAGVVVAVDTYNAAIGEKASAIFARASDPHHIPCVAEPAAYSIGNGQAAQVGLNEKCYALDTMHDAQAVLSIHSTQDPIHAVERTPALDKLACIAVTTQRHVLRRLTPLECTRLQGFPDAWLAIGEWTDTKGKRHKDADSPKYKALGNSIALPFWEWMAKRMVAVLKRDGVENPTMCSMFSGIGGFELCFARSGCQPVWNSEIEEFPIAVTKYHFGDEAEGTSGDIEKYLHCEPNYVVAKADASN